MRNFEIKNNDSLSRKGRGSQTGRSMIEMLGVLAIIGVLSVGGIAGYSKAMMKYRINKTIEQITLIAGNVRAFWGPQKNYIGVSCSGYNCKASGCSGQSSGDGCPIHKKAKIFPDEMITVTNGKIMSITNPFGGEVNLYSVVKSQSGDMQAFVMESLLPQEACIELATHDWSSAGVNAISINGPVPLITPPVDLNFATDNCFDGYNEIRLHFGIDVNSNFWK
ncbi:MAG: hypothetical protein IJ525_06675 [Alphaproteobacteria bacterium]|nr:hypothetical protein [Alphaproteobacteria bacterium]